MSEERIETTMFPTDYPDAAEPPDPDELERHAIGEQVSLAMRTLAEYPDLAATMMHRIYRRTKAYADKKPEPASEGSGGE